MHLLASVVSISIMGVLADADGPISIHRWLLLTESSFVEALPRAEDWGAPFCRRIVFSERTHAGSSAN